MEHAEFSKELTEGVTSLVRKFFFSQRVVDSRNKLPAHVEAEIQSTVSNVDWTNVRVGAFKATASTARHNQSQSQRSHVSILVTRISGSAGTGAEQSVKAEQTQSAATVCS